MIKVFYFYSMWCLLSLSLSLSLSKVMLTVEDWKCFCCCSALMLSIDSLAFLSVLSITPCLFFFCLYPVHTFCRMVDCKDIRDEESAFIPFLICGAFSWCNQELVLWNTMKWKSEQTVSPSIHDSFLNTLFLWLYRDLFACVSSRNTRFGIHAGGSLNLIMRYHCLIRGRSTEPKYDRMLNQLVKVLLSDVWDRQCNPKTTV